MSLNCLDLSPLLYLPKCRLALRHNPHTVRKNHTYSTDRQSTTFSTHSSKAETLVTGTSSSSHSQHYLVDGLFTLRCVWVGGGCGESPNHLPLVIGGRL